jgi:cytochrome c oxidase cbb3-type subunit 3
MTGASIALLACLVAPSAAGAAEAGKAIYAAQCQMCHGADGSGGTPAGRAIGVAPFSRFQLSAAAMTTVILNGQGRMPAYRVKLTPAQITAVVQYIQQLR